ncbi:MAG: hypothetical protein GC149_07740 [Gammaproteobacteria bacterium]|nr:hypothetical protein [Gammaproteobacteria bacterium]
MITDANRYYGAAVISIVDLSTGAVKIKRISESPAGFYFINDILPIYIKYSTSRRGPWVFNFHQGQQEFQESLYKEYKECIMVFICGKDGIAALRHDDFRKILDNEFDVQETVTIRRKHNEMYKVRGKNGALERRISRSSFEDIFQEHERRELIKQ